MNKFVYRNDVITNYNGIQLLSIKSDKYLANIMKGVKCKITHFRYTWLLNGC